VAWLNLAIDMAEGVKSTEVEAPAGTHLEVAQPESEEAVAWTARDSAGFWERGGAASRGWWRHSDAA
jgi:hypothetical protein